MVGDIEVYTDGACKKLLNTTFGGWAYVILVEGELFRYESGSELNSTNQRMELIAAIKGLEYAIGMNVKNSDIILYSDSAYLINCEKQGWYKKWISNGWKNAKGMDVLNQDLWFKLIPFFKNPRCLFRHVLGHNNVFFNEKCDKLAQSAAENLKRTWKGENDDTE